MVGNKKVFGALAGTVVVLAIAVFLLQGQASPLAPEPLVPENPQGPTLVVPETPLGTLALFMAFAAAFVALLMKSRPVSPVIS